MFKVLRHWFDRYLSNEEAVIFAIMLVGFFVVMTTMGSILAPLLSSIVLAYVLQHIVTLIARATPQWVAFWSTFLMFLFGFFWLVVLLIPQLGHQMSRLFEELPNMADRLKLLLERLSETFPALISEQQIRNLGELIYADMAEISQWILSFSLSQLPLAIAVPVYIILLPILVFFLLKDKDMMIDWVLGFLPRERPVMHRIAREMHNQMSHYINGKFLECIAVGLVTYVFFFFIDLDYSVLLACLVGVSVIVPYVGVAVVTIPVVIVAWLQFGYSGTFVLAVGGHALIQALDGFVLVPALFSVTVRLHPVAIIMAILVFGFWWGFWGVFFAIPLAVLIQSVISAWPRPEPETRQKAIESL